MPGRRLSAQALPAARLRAHRAQRPEGLSRRRRALAPAVRIRARRASAARPTAAIRRVLGEHAGLRDPLTLHNFYVPAGGDEPDPAVNPKFAHKLAFLDEMREHAGLRPARGQRAILVGDLNVAPLEYDVWSHKPLLKVVSHTPVECEKLTAAQKAGGWIDSPAPSHAGAGEALHLVELPRARLGAPPTTAAGSITSGCRTRSATGSPPSRSPRTRAARDAAVRPRAGDGDAGGLRPDLCLILSARGRQALRRSFETRVAHHEPVARPFARFSRRWRAVGLHRSARAVCCAAASG